MSVMQLTLLTSLSMMGAGIIMLPAKFAEIGAISMLSWIVTALASGAVAYVFAQCGMLSKNWEDWAALPNMPLANPALLSSTMLMPFHSSSATLPSLWQP